MLQAPGFGNGFLADRCEKSPIGELPIGELPIGELPIGELPIGELPIGEPPIGLSGLHGLRQNDVISIQYPEYAGLKLCGIQAHGAAFWQESKLIKTCSAIGWVP